MKINTLQSLINQQITQVGHGGQAGRLTETNPLTENSHQISTAEKAFANEVLEHVKNTALSRHDIACLLPRVSNLELK
ncbi:type III secretion system exported negative regulator LcrQ/YscM1, partial [Yersinia pestis]